MIPIRVLALDISSKTGWASMISGPDGIELEAAGQIPAIPEPEEGQYPASYVNWAYMCFEKIAELVDRHAPDVLVIEETVAGSKSVYSQKILEFIHFLVARMIRDTGIKCKYFLTGEWRSIVGCLMTKEEKERNKAVKLHNKKLEETGAVKKTRARDKSGNVIGKISKKHVNIRRANEIFGDFLDKPLVKKDEDMADALLLAVTYHFVRVKNESST